MQFYNKLSEFALNYEYFIFDVWGVVHDGVHIYDGVIETLNFLRRKNKKICFLSNAPRRASKVKDVLLKYGINQDFYDFILTSGEATYFDLEKNQKNNFRNFGKKYFYIGPNKDIDLLAGLDYHMVEDAKEANFAIATGFDHEKSLPDEKRHQIEAARENNLPLICVNPDLIVVKKDGYEMICAGILAAEYEKLSGQVLYYGKPYQAVYDIALAMFNNPDKNKILAIGDGMETDIKGARDFGIASALVTSGILCNKLGVSYGQQANKNKVQEICESYGFFPTYVIPNL